MSISNDQPISAGNLKAALDGLTGGSLLSYDVLLDVEGGQAYRNYQMKHPVNDYAFILVIACNDSGEFSSGFTCPVGSSATFQAWGSPYISYATMNGSTWNASDSCWPRYVIGFKL